MWQFPIWALQPYTVSTEAYMSSALRPQSCQGIDSQPSYQPSKRFQFESKGTLRERLVILHRKENRNHTCNSGIFEKRRLTCSFTCPAAFKRTRNDLSERCRNRVDSAMWKCSASLQTTVTAPLPTSTPTPSPLPLPIDGFSFDALRIQVRFCSRSQTMVRSLSGYPLIPQFRFCAANQRLFSVHATRNKRCNAAPIPNMKIQMVKPRGA